MRVVASLGVAFCAILAGQAPESPPAPRKTEMVAPLKNSGLPMSLSFECRQEDIQWAGLTCTDEEPCPVYLELSTVSGAGARITVAGNIHSAETTLFSVLLQSEDSGRTWREAFERKRGYGLDHIQFLGAQHGWISGGLLHPLPRDPLFLITSDGGTTWRERPVFAEGTGGTISQFRFDSPGAGTMLVDRLQATESARYELYETPNGGETWIIRRASNQPIPLKPPAGAAEQSWRVRADARTNSYQIERLERERWISVAGFLVPVGSCRAAPPTVPPPAEPPSGRQPAAPQQDGL